MSSPSLFLLNYTNQPPVSLCDLRRPMGPKVRRVARRSGLFYKGSIRSSQKLIIFYSKFFRKTWFVHRAALFAPICRRGELGRIRRALP
jgi:hypothetical protein